MMCVVPSPDGRLGKVVLVAEEAEARGGEREIAPSRRFEAEPTGGEHAQDMGARKYQDIAADGAHAADDAIGPCPDLVRSFPARATVAEQLPVRALREDLGGAAAFILAIVPLRQIRIEFGYGSEPRKLASLDRALQGAGEDLGKGQPAQPLPEGPGVVFSALGQGQIGSAGMLARQAPRGLAVPGQIDDRKRFSHDLLPLCRPASIRPPAARSGATNGPLR